VCPSVRLTARSRHRTTGGILIKFGIEEYEGWNFNSGNYLFTTDTK